MPMKVCIDCGTIFPAEHIGAKRCCLCAAKHGTEPTTEKVYPKPPVDDLTRDVRQADASGKSYGFWRAGLLLAKQKAREEMEVKKAQREQPHEEKGKQEK